MASITVDSTTMRDKATIFTNVANSIKSITDEMTTTINGLNQDWSGTSAEELVRKFGELAPSFEEKCNTINSYAGFLNSAAETYDQAEQQITQAVTGDSGE